MGVSRAALAGAGLLLVAVVAFAFSGARHAHATRPAPTLPTEVLQGPRVTVASLHGKPALVNFWASWCGPCKREAPALATAQRQLAGGARIVGVDWGDNARNARAFIRSHGWSYPVVRDASDEVGTRYGIAGLPTTFVLDGRGRIVRKLIGPQSAAQLVQAVRAVRQ
jgi:cytochrome c biogenesis protein CcmG, thiol:disulfide interchange protein DsbE